MAGFADLVTKCSPAFYGRGVNGTHSAGRSWSWTWINVRDNDGEPIDLTAVTGACALVDTPGGSAVLELEFDGGMGTFTISADEDDTAGLFSGTNYTVGRECKWYLTLTDGTDSVQIWMVDNSPFFVRRGV